MSSIASITFLCACFEYLRPLNFPGKATMVAFFSFFGFGILREGSLVGEFGVSVSSHSLHVLSFTFVLPCSTAIIHVASHLLSPSAMR